MNQPRVWPVPVDGDSGSASGSIGLHTPLPETRDHGSRLAASGVLPPVMRDHSSDSSICWASSLSEKGAVDPSALLLAELETEEEGGNLQPVGLALRGGDQVHGVGEEVVEHVVCLRVGWFLSRTTQP